MKITMMVVFLLLTMGVFEPRATSQEESHAGEGLLNQLLAPGPLTKNHKDLEGTDCLKCHSAGSEESKILAV